MNTKICPLCKGEGKLIGPLYMDEDVCKWIHSGGNICRVCNGSGYIQK